MQFIKLEAALLKDSRCIPLFNQTTLAFQMNRKLSD
ncbi:hypothetical protein XBP1_3010001 [Xenorhabdus bovienii str. puntauvense]|uniref:Uncharacterized protein n=2 Tax=Xenorhabdus bovienii TaxID=40576 RepID=A0A0B6XBB5_XENBV|nr:hypothetical protein XBFFR1_2070031 [Xenorhabdus bovienii str. feltiae France]CDG90977.1 hypothetical protein XBFFL1_1190071 [Xenorhabdus bovienii str. feltiae Florida]CDG98352.1 hypothetical protein XBP1_3010001 [Xenorhabdus bovienii str. puntauvense]CDM90466.1 protein of unknown function [Xenorhabdus bovienii]